MIRHDNCVTATCGWQASHSFFRAFAARGGVPGRDAGVNASLAGHSMEAATRLNGTSSAACPRHKMLWRTKREYTPQGNLSPIRSAFGPIVNARRRIALLPVRAETLTISLFWLGRPAQRSALSRPLTLSGNSAGFVFRRHFCDSACGAENESRDYILRRTKPESERSH